MRFFIVIINIDFDIVYSVGVLFLECYTMKRSDNI